PQLPPMPSPNGYEQAATALARLSQIRRPPLPKNWPEATPSELQAQLAAVRPILDQIDAALQLQWRAPPMRNESDFEAAQPALLYLRECARSYFAQSSLRGSRGDYATAMQNCLDAMELGAKSAHGSVLANWFTAVACHAIGLRGAEQMALRVPADALPGMLA